MITTEQLAESYGLNLRIIRMQTDGLTHADSLIQTSYNINCLNWVLGHIAVGRDRVLRLLDAEPLLKEAETSRYRSGSNPIKGDVEDIIPLERLLDILIKGQEIIFAKLTQKTEDDLAREIDRGDRTSTLGSLLHGLYFHDTYHTGQTEILRQVAGKHDKVI